MRVCSTIGQLLPFYCSGVGRAIMAFLPEHLITAALESYDYRPYTERTITNAEDLKKQLVVIRERGFAIDDEEFEKGTFCVGTPIFDSRRDPIAGISVSLPKIRVNDALLAKIADRLLTFSREITKELY